MMGCVKTIHPHLLEKRNIRKWLLLLLYVIMNLKQLSAITLIICMCVGITSCDKDFIDSETNNKELMGEWKAVSIKTLYNEGVEVDADSESISRRLKGYDWVVITEKVLVSIQRGCYFAYKYQNKRLNLEYKNIYTFFIKEVKNPITIESINENEIIVRYKFDSAYSLITYKRLEPFNVDKLLGEWQASEFIATHNNGKSVFTIGGNEIGEELNGLEWILFTKNTLTMMEPVISLPYSIEDGVLVLSPLLLLNILSIKCDEHHEQDKLFVLYASTQKEYTAVITYDRISNK